MCDEQDAMKVVRAELSERLANLRAFAPTSGRHDFIQSLHALRTLARTYGLNPVVRLAEALERSVAETQARLGAGLGMTLYLDRLQDAIGCSRTDDQASEAMIASVSVRLHA